MLVLEEMTVDAHDVPLRLQRNSTGLFADESRVTTKSLAFVVSKAIEGSQPVPELIPAEMSK